MRRAFILLTGAALLLSGCGSYEATGAYTGSTFGHMIGSAVGGIAGGWRGHEIGSLIGTVGGAVVGGAIGSAADRKEQRRYEERAQARRQQAQRPVSAADDTYAPQGTDDSGFDPAGRGDDRIDFTGGSNDYPAAGNGYPAAGSMARGFSGPALSISNAGVYEEQRDGVLTRGERCTVIFEIRNNTSQPVYDVFPLVSETTGNRHIHISPNLRVESIAPHQAIRYTATLMADSRLRDGRIEVCVGVAQGSRVLESQNHLFDVPTSKRSVALPTRR